MRTVFKETAFLMTLAIAFCVWAGLAAQKGGLSSGVWFGVCDWTIGKTGDPAALELASKLGLEGVQVSLVIKNDGLELAQAALQKSYLEAAEKYGIGIASFAIGDLNNIPYKSDPRAEKWIEQSIDICRAMNVKIVLVPFFGKGDLKNDPKGTETVIERLKRVAPKAENAGVILALESWLSAEDHLKILSAVGSPAIQVYYDVGNSQEAGYDILKEIRLLGARICQFHAKDYKDLYGKGTMDFKAVRKAMDEIGYHNWFVLEGTQLPLGVEKSIRYDLDYLRTIFPTR
ncbi:MAG: sugar phosphate isomerase/epimerase [Candidatus Aminicenantes bacterium]|jgi:L-ribulose-5-phosphate 3-epimerase|nr:sugar phosphate isomerase/epimerase [Candidatus Aminicenantes bacterium]